MSGEPAAGTPAGAETSRPRRRRLVLLAVLWLVLIAVVAVGWRRLDRRLAVARACDVVAAEEWEAALESSRELVGTDPPGLAAAECRCLALFATGELDAGLELLDRLLADPATGDWLPEPVLVLTAVAHRRAQGRLGAAAELVRRGTAAYPRDADLLALELEVRAEMGGEKAVLEDLERRLPEAGEAAPRLRLLLAGHHLERGEAGPAARLLGPAPPPGPPERVADWHRLRARAFGVAGDPAGVAAVCRRWLEAGGRPADVLAWHALTLSIYQLDDPENPTLELLREAVARSGELSDPSWLPALHYRFIGTLIVAGRTDEALERLAAAERLGLEIPITRDDVRRSAAGPGAGAWPGESAPGEVAAGEPGTLRFRIPDPAAGARLLLSPDAGAPLDRDFVSLPVPAGGAVEVERTPGPAPQRWVYQGAGGAPLASGTVWPSGGRTVEVEVAVAVPGPASSGPASSGPVASTTTQPFPEPGDGQRRVFFLILDCADWRFVQYLRTRGELPVFDHLLRTGHRAVLESRPAFTAAALDSLVFPEQRRNLSPVGVIHQLGVELAGNTFIEENPFAGLAWLLPESPTLFERLGAGDHAAVNLLFSVGNLRGGDHGERVGPHGEKGRFTDWRSRRPLDPDERRLFADAELGENPRIWIEEAAAALDAAENVAEDPSIDLLALRVPTLDPATHSSFSTLQRAGQDDARHWLYDLYRYLDHRLGGLRRRLDGDDVLVVASDHGIRTSLEHSPWAFFVAVGPGLPPGRTPGTPHLRGIPRMLAELLGVETRWPATGIEGWVRELDGVGLGGGGAPGSETPGGPSRNKRRDDGAGPRPSEPTTARSADDAQRP